MGLFGNKFKEKNKEKMINKYESDAEFKKNVDNDITIIKRELPKIIKNLKIDKFTSIHTDSKVYMDGDKYYIQILKMDCYKYAALNNLSARKDIEEIEKYFFDTIDKIDAKIKENKNIKVLKKIDFYDANDWDDFVFVCIF